MFWKGSYGLYFGSLLAEKSKAPLNWKQNACIWWMLKSWNLLWKLCDWRSSFWWRDVLESKPWTTWKESGGWGARRPPPSLANPTYVCIKASDRVHMGSVIAGRWCCRQNAGMMDFEILKTSVRVMWLMQFFLMARFLAGWCCRPNACMMDLENLKTSWHLCDLCWIVVLMYLLLYLLSSVFLSLLISFFLSCCLSFFLCADLQSLVAFLFSSFV